MTAIYCIASFFFGAIAALITLSWMHLPRHGEHETTNHGGTP